MKSLTANLSMLCSQCAFYELWWKTRSMKNRKNAQL